MLCSKSIQEGQNLKLPWSHVETVAEIVRNKWSHFAPKIMDPFREVADYFAKFSRQQQTKVSIWTISRQVTILRRTELTRHADHFPGIFVVQKQI